MSFTYFEVYFYYLIIVILCTNPIWRRYLLALTFLLPMATIPCLQGQHHLKESAASSRQQHTFWTSCYCCHHIRNPTIDPHCFHCYYSSSSWNYAAAATMLYYTSVIHSLSTSPPLCAHVASTISCTRRMYSFLSSTNSFAASEFAGELGLGSDSRDCMDVNMADTSYMALH